MERGRGRESESGFSNYFRERFGSQSPEDYRNIRLSHIDPRVSNNELRDVLAKNFGRYGDHQVKVVNSNIPDDRLAYVNFEQLGHAKRCRKALLPKLQDVKHSVFFLFLLILSLSALNSRDSSSVSLWLARLFHCSYNSPALGTGVS